jgi:hypothetical protein
MNTSRSAVVLALLWPLGLILTVAYMEIDAVTLPVFLVLDLLYVAAAVTVFRGLRARLDDTGTRLTLLGLGLFAGVGVTGPPSADEPGLMTLNTAALLVVAVALLAVATRLVVERRHSPVVGPAVSALVLLAVGSTAYLINLVSRVAIHLTGAAPQQAAVEDTNWLASEYLRGLDDTPDFMALLLTWQDLVQLGYVVTTYLAAAALARLLRSEGEVSHRAGTALVRAAYTLAGLLLGGIVLAVALPREADLVPAWVAFVTSIPFMTTLAPYALGVAWLVQRRGGPVSTSDLAESSLVAAKSAPSRH